MRLPALFLALLAFFGSRLLGQPAMPKAWELAVFGPAEPPRAAAATPLTVNTSSREEVRQFFRGIYGVSDGVAMGWTGSYANGTPGDTSAAYKEAVQLRINFYRALVGVPATITLNATNNGKDQHAALMMSANRALSHFPPTSWTFYTAVGAEAAANSNLSLGSAGPDAITGYMNDNGDNNTAVGHRRWLIYPQTLVMGTGDVPGDGANLLPANATWVLDGQFGTARPATRTTAVPYPPAGYVPYELVWPRWSFSYPNASFTNATVTMTRNGTSIPVMLEPLASNLGEPALVWVYDNQDADAGLAHARPTADTVYAVNISNVVVSGVPQNFSYNVTVFDPDVAGPDFLPTTLTGSATPAVGAANTYGVAKQSFASSFDWRVVQMSAFSKTYDGSAGLDGITAVLTPGYSAVATGVSGATGAAFHLAHPEFETQSLTLPETFLVGASGAINFRSRLSWATATQIAHVQVSTDEGASWTDAYSQAGTGNAGENSFTNRTASLAAYNGKTIRVRFSYTVTQSGFPQTDNTVGWFLDSISLSGVEQTSAGAATNVTGATTFSYTPSAPATVGLQARGVLFGAYPLEWGPVKPVTAAAATTVSPEPLTQTVAVNGAATFAVTSPGSTYQWQLNGTDLSGATSSSYTATNVSPSKTGIYTARVTTGGTTATSAGAVLGLSSTTKLVGPGTEFPDIFHGGTGFTYDQILLGGGAAALKADPGQIVRISFVDLSNDIVQVEFSGAGTLSLVLDGVTGPANPVNYNQSVTYMKGHAGIVLTGADANTHLSVFSVGRANAADPTGAFNPQLPISPTNNPANNGNPIFSGHAGTTYDGVADIAFIAITSTDGKFGGLRTANASYFATRGYTGVYAPGVEFTGPVYIGDIRAADDATPVIMIGSGSTTQINGGDLAQTNGRAVQVSGLTQLRFVQGSNSHGVLFNAQTNQARLEQNGTDVTSSVVVNP